MVNSIKAGITFGALLGLTHLSWALLVALGWAQSLMDFVFWMHFIGPIYVVQPFSLSTAAILVVITSVSGFFIAFIFGVIWNRLLSETDHVGHRPVVDISITSRMFAFGDPAGAEIVISA